MLAQTIANCELDLFSETGEAIMKIKNILLLYEKHSIYKINRVRERVICSYSVNKLQHFVIPNTVRNRFSHDYEKETITSHTMSFKGMTTG